jgi:hypothetical protein
MDAGFEQAPVVLLVMVDILPVWVRGVFVGVAYLVGVLCLAVIVASGREGMSLGFDFSNSENSVGHGTVGKDRQAA